MRQIRLHTLNYVQFKETAFHILERTKICDLREKKAKASEV